MIRFATLLALLVPAAAVTPGAQAAPQSGPTQLTPAQIQLLLNAQKSGSITVPPGVSLGSSGVTISRGAVVTGGFNGGVTNVMSAPSGSGQPGAAGPEEEEEVVEEGIKLLVNGEVLDLPAMPEEILNRVIEDMRAQGLEVELLAKDDERAKAPEKKEAVDPMYLQLLQQAVLDRRPSTILRVWSEPELLAPDEDPELTDPEDPEPIEDAPTAPEAPVEPTLPEGLTEPTPPEDIEVGVDGIADVVALAKARAEAAATYETDKAAYDEAVAAHELALAAFGDEKAAYDLTKARFEVDKALWDKKKAAFDKEVAKVNAKKAQLKAKRTQREIALFNRNVTLGRWEPVGEALMKIGEKPAKGQYTQLLGKISRSPQQMSGQLAPFQEQPAFEFEDIIRLIAIAPGGFENKQATQIAPLVRRVFAQGHSLDDWLTRLRDEVARPEEERVVSKRLAALILTAQSYNKELAEFLPTFDEMVEADDREGLNLLARHHMRMHSETPTPEVLGKAWEATLAVLNPGEVDKKQKKEALKRAVDLAGRVRDAKGDAWLRETFTERPERGMEVLAVIGGEASTGMVKSSYGKVQRLDDLKLLRGAVDSLLEIAPERADEWQETLTLLADTWLREAVHSFKNAKQESLGPSSRRDAYGNMYWYDYDYNYGRQSVTPIEPSELLEVRPDGAWRETLPDSLKPKIDQTIAQLYLKVSEEEQAFPYIQALAGPEPEKANDLAQTFIEVWLKNNDPNASRNRSSIYNFSYGFNRRASGIPLTRSRQDRNLRALSDWVQKLRGVEGIELDSDLLVRAFTQCHSEAEVYRVDIMEEVFGDLDLLKPETLAAMTQRMRANLATLWRNPAVQRNAKTNRKQKEIEAEVQRGYAVAAQMLDRALATYPGDWRLQQAKGALLHDLNNYRAELKVDKGFAERRIAALEVLRGAAQAYTDGIGELQVNEYAVDAYMTWFYAALGASDIGAITESTLLRQSEIPAIKGMLDGIEGEAGEKHRAMFANLIFTRLSAVNPAVKNRYLESGFEVAGDHPQAKAARRVYEYYQDLVTEIELVARLDGTSDVGTEPFGVRIDLRYTKEIGRESGGFAKYLQNQANAVNSYYYNGGRPQENYRDKFEEAARTLLEEQFEVMSVTFNREDAASRADGDGWQAMSYAYVLMRAKGPEVDQVPPLKIDLDFNDVTGYVVLPITSPVVAIDADAEAEVRPYEALSITQILDERKADEGKLVLEVKAQAEGLIPGLDDITEIAPRDFQVSDVADQGLSVARFSDDEDSVVSQRLWVVELEPKEGVVAPDEFTFATPLDDAVEPVYQRYADADLITAEATVPLGERYQGEKKFPWAWVLGLFAAGAIFVIGLVLFLTRSKGPKLAQQGARLPEEITPVTVLGLLGDVRRSGSLPDTDRADLDRTALEIEAHYFGQRNGSESPDLVAIAKRWVSRVPQTS